MIAISYRREDSLPVTGRLFDRLQAEFGKGNVFMDFDSIPYGVDFRDHIKQMIDRSNVLIAMIGPDWVGRRKQRSRRIDDPADFVRLEIAYALERKLPIIPVLVSNTKMPRPEELPKDIEGLAFRNGLSLDVGIDFHHHAERLVGAINGIVKPPRAPSTVIQRPHAPASAAEVSLAPPETTLRRVDGPPAAKVVATPLPISLPTKTPSAPAPKETPEQKSPSAPPTPWRPKLPMETKQAMRKMSPRSWDWKKFVGVAIAVLSLAAVVTTFWNWQAKPSSRNPKQTDEKEKTYTPIAPQPAPKTQEQVPDNQPSASEPTASASIVAENPSSVTEPSASASTAASPNAAMVIPITDWVPAESAPRDEHNRPIYIVVASDSGILNVRSDHSATSSVVEKLMHGDRVFLQDGRIQNNDPPHPTTWQKVQTVNGATGWIAASFLAPGDEAAAASTTAQSPTPDSTPEDAEVRQLFEQWLQFSNSNSNDVKQEASLYADPVDFYDIGSLNRQQLEQWEEKDRSRWPQQYYGVPKGPVIQKLGDSEWQVTFEMNFDARNPSQVKRVTGTASLTWAVRKRASGGVEIASVKEQVTSRTYHDVKGRQTDSAPARRTGHVVKLSPNEELWVHMEPRANSSSLTRLHVGDRLYLENSRVRADNPAPATVWQKVTTMNGYTGWVKADYVESGE